MNSEWLRIQKRVNPVNYQHLQRQYYAEKIKNYNPIISADNKRISKCGWCGEQYIKTANKQKYCSSYCRDSARSHQSRMKSHKWYHRHKHELTEKQRWGLGSSTIGKHRNPNFKREQKILTKELKRLGIYKRK